MFDKQQSQLLSFVQSKVWKKSLFSNQLLYIRNLFLYGVLHISYLQAAPFAASTEPAPANSPLSAPLLPLDQSTISNKSAIDENRIQIILDFWFGPLPDPAYFPQAKVPLWFDVSFETNRQLRLQFLPDVMRAIQGELNHWRETPKGRLALILLLDLFPRHIYRNTSQAFMSDSMARGLAIEGIQRGDDQLLYPIERAFFYLPLEHTESPLIQAQSVALYEKLVLQSPRELLAVMQDFYAFAVLHQQQIARFGRFPHRNQILKRESTPEEIIFLLQWKQKEHS